MEVSFQLHALAALSMRKEPGTHRIGGLVDPEASLDVVAKRKSCPARN
jgi:hypothetical protein